MATQFKPITIISYSLFLIVISSLITVLCYHIFVFNTFATDDSQTQAFREVSAAQIADSPIKEARSIIEVMSYGCHYCAANEENLAEFSRTLPPGSSFTSIHITSENSGLAAYAPIFATLEEMGIEKKVRDSAYNAVITRNVDLADEKALNAWLGKNNIDADKFKTLRQSDAVKTVSARWRRLPHTMTLTRRRCLLSINAMWWPRTANFLNLRSACCNC